jgi:hypothetical protein
MPGNLLLPWLRTKCSTPIASRARWLQRNMHRAGEDCGNGTRGAISGPGRRGFAGASKPFPRWRAEPVESEALEH